MSTMSSGPIVATYAQSPSRAFLDRVSEPGDFRGFSALELRGLADDVRHEMIEAVGVTGGHLGSGLGVVELTVALHYVFDTPNDKLVWDVGHQAYPHKILTGRRDRMRTLRQDGADKVTRGLTSVEEILRVTQKEVA